MSKIINTVKGVCTDVISHWKTPAKGNFVPYKEVINFGVGGMGQQFVMILIGYMGLGVGNTLLGSTIGIRPLHLQNMATILTVLNFAFFIIRGKIVDNTRTKIGRFRPYIAIMGFPLVILSAIYIFLPFETLNYTQKLICTFVFTIAIAMISPMFTDTYSELGTCITPNSEERAKVMTIQSLIYSFAPTIAYAIIPILSDLTGGYTNIKTYRFIIVPMAALGVSLNFFTAFGCKERVVTSKSYVQKIGVIEGALEIYKNKHWWLRQWAGTIGFLEGACGVLFSWIYIYGTQDMTTYAILTTVLGTASGIGMAITPFLIKKLGNKKLLLAHNGLNVIFVFLMIFTFKIPIVFFILFYLNSFVNALQLIYNPVMHSEVKDYQQYISGKRMDFMFGTAGMIFMPITMLTGYFIPSVYESMGLTTNYDILYDPTVRNSMFLILCILSVIGAIMNLIPYAFYSLSREKHRNIIKVLEYRALFDDFENDCMNDESIKRTVEGVNETLSYVNAPNPDFQVLKNNIKNASTKIEKFNAKAELKKAKQLVVEKDAATILTDELSKFENDIYQHKINLARSLVSKPIEQIKNIDKSVVEKAKNQPKSTKIQRSIRRDDIIRAKKLLKASKLIKSNYPNGIIIPSVDQINQAYAMEDKTKEQATVKKQLVKKLEKEMRIYHQTVGVYLEAEKLLKDYEVHNIVFEKAVKRYNEIVNTQNQLI